MDPAWPKRLDKWQLTIFSWTAGTDADSGIKGYCPYLGTDDTADPATSKGIGHKPGRPGSSCQFMVTGNDMIRDQWLHSHSVRMMTHII